MVQRTYFTFTDFLIQILDLLAQRDNRQASTLAANVFPELSAIFETGNNNAALFVIEHESDHSNVLYAHIRNVLVHKLSGVETRSSALFQPTPSLDEDRFKDLCDHFTHIDRDLHLAPVLRAALVFSDISKGGSPERREDWKTHYGMDLSIHNEASAILLEKTSLLNRYMEFRHSEILQKLVIFMVRYHGLIGQYIRGEIPGAYMDSVVSTIHKLGCELWEQMDLDDETTAIKAVVRMYWLMNVLDTSAVREGLMTSALYGQFEAIALLLEIAACNDTPFCADPGFIDVDGARGYLENRMTALRGNAIQAGESPDNIRRAIALIDNKHIIKIYKTMSKCALWYFEAASGRLSAQSQLNLLLLGLYGLQTNGLDNETICNLDFVHIANVLSPMSPTLDAQVARSRSGYRVRILDAMLNCMDAHKILDGTADIYKNNYIFAVNSTKGGRNSLSIKLTVSEESDALITLLSIYERKSTVSFHSALKMLCDLYNLRKDDFDRLTNEAQYLATMNAAKDDKARMMKYLNPGKMVEVGPGGGVVLDLLADNFPDSSIFGLDASHQVVVALEQRKKQTNAKWKIIEGNAFDFLSYFERESLTDIIFCSILHEIYSYIETEDGSRFKLESVQKMLKSAFDALAPGGRILIRDGIMPEHRQQLLTFRVDEAKSFFEAFCREFKGRTIEYEWVNDNTVRIDSADAMEFMYTYTWGPESFPYEVREQYGIMTYPDYCNAILEWLGDRARLVRIPDNEALVLQPGYVTALKDKLQLSDLSGNPLPFLPSNAIIVIEKIRQS